jgi:hypothetical protein
MEINSSDQKEDSRHKLSSVIINRAMVWFISSLVLFIPLEILAHTKFREEVTHTRQIDCYSKRRSLEAPEISDSITAGLSSPSPVRFIRFETSHSRSADSGAHLKASYHDRMPVILDEKDFDGWLDCSLGANTSGQSMVWEMNGTNVIGGGAVSPNPGSSWRAVA